MDFATLSHQHDMDLQAKSNLQYGVFDVSKNLQLDMDPEVK